MSCKKFYFVKFSTLLNKATINLNGGIDNIILKSSIKLVSSSRNLKTLFNEFLLNNVENSLEPR